MATSLWYKTIEIVGVKDKLEDAFNDMVPVTNVSIRMMLGES